MSAVQARLAAGAQIVGSVTSVVWHAGEVDINEEFQFLSAMDRWDDRRRAGPVEGFDDGRHAPVLSGEGGHDLFDTPARWGRGNTVGDR
ncbi:hypothetical protein ACIQI8_42755 [Streptomyces sp. NPDC092369]|uniref:hypothetical protein n=1 Tax=Streptomyces sp. NPDC092369 TaxID=3366015 RepID=UPI003828FF30